MRKLKPHLAVRAATAGAILLGVPLGFAPLSIESSLAAGSQCLIVVNGTTYLDGGCGVYLSPDGLTLGVGVGMGQSHSRFFAFIQMDPGGEARGYWNGPSADSHAGDLLGTLRRDGSCWIGEKAKICAWKH